MQVNYRGFKLEAVRDDCADGNKLVYFSATQISDDWVMIEEFADASNRLPSVIKVLKGRVDRYYGGKTKRVVEKLIKAPQIKRKLKELLEK
jgi:peptidoglycan hydrolase-like protein with peptidoglycan-binding domain